MAKNTHITEEVRVDVSRGDQPEGYINPDVTLVILTWVTFFLLLAVLYKFAWKPILSLLDEREKAIKKSVEDADRIQQELAKLEDRTRTMISQASTESKLIVDEARKAASEAAKSIEYKAKEEAKIVLENARRDLAKEVEKAKEDLRNSSAQLAIDLAGKIIEENLDSAKNQKLVNQYINEI